MTGLNAGAMLSGGVIEVSTPLAEVAGRLLLAMVLGGVLGLDREVRHRPAGLRTHILVSLGAALFALLAEAIMTSASAADDGSHMDATRLLEGVITGIGFLGAGTIIQNRGKVKGLTTAAGLWVAAGVGMGAGLGLYLLAIMATAAAAITLTAMYAISSRVVEGGNHEEDDEDGG